MKTQEVDILVIGGGMAGVFAALGAKTPDVSVAIIEPSNILGGQGTAGGVAGFCGDSQRVNAPFAELVATLSEHKLIAAYQSNADRRPFDLEHCGFYLQEQVAKAGVDIYFHARALDAQTENGTLTSIRISCASDEILFQPKMVIDATGDCVIAVQAGFETFHEAANVQLPMSLYFTLWDSGKKVTPHLPPGCPTWKTDDDLPMTTLHIFDSGKVEVKMKVVGFDAADGQSLSQAEIHARRQMMGLIYHLQTVGYQGKKLDQHMLASVSRHIGQREGRRIVGEYVLTEHDVTHAATFSDAVAVGTYHLDYHWPDKVERAGTGITTMVEPYHIPLRSLIAKGAKNLLIPGRGLSGDQMAMSSYRVQATCAQTGFATGKTAWQCIKDQTDLTTVSVSAIQKNIENNGQSLNLSDYGDYLRRRILTHEHIFENAPFASCHASSLVQLPNNHIFAVWFAGSREGADDVGIWGSDRINAQWSPPRRLSKVRDLPHWNPVLFTAPNGDLHLFFKVSTETPPFDGKRKRVTDGWETWRIISTDQGQTWSDPHPIVPGDTLGRGPVKNKPITLSNGDCLAGASIEIRNPTASEKPDIWDVFVDRSSDTGKTWTASEYLTLDRTKVAGKGVIQPTLWESTPGHVHMLARSTEDLVYRADSTDFGHTWSPLYPIDFPNNNSGLDITKLPDGTLALICNPVTKGRHPLSLLLSQDNGQTWPHRLDIETEPGEYSYPAIIATATGIALTYTHNRKTIAFWHGSVEQMIT